MIDRLLPTNNRRCLAWLIWSAFVIAHPAPPTATAGTITGAHSFSIVARLTGPAGSNSINPTSQVGIGGTDLGHMVNHKGKTYFLFGDTFAGEGTNETNRQDWRYNVMSYSTDSTPANGITFDGWITRANGTARQVIHPGAEQGVPGFGPVTYIPTGAISANDKIYAWSMRIDWDGFTSQPSDGWMLSHAGLASWRVGDSQFTDVPGFRFESPNGGAYSWAEGREGPGNFGMVAASYRSPLEGVDDRHVYLWGTPGGREGGVKLGRVLPEYIENLSAYEFYDGMFNGVPRWVDNEFAADKIVPSRPEGGTGVGEMSVMYNEAAGAWTMMYVTGGGQPDFEIRQAPQPWGPWSAPVRVADFSQAPGLYSPYMNPLYVEDDGKTLYFTMSLWNPYDVYMAKVTLNILPHHSADFTGDGLVDAADLTQWRRDFGSNYLSDADDDGDSDGDDFLQWQRQLGSTQSVSSSTAAPEPSGVVIALSAIGVRLTRRRGGRTSF